LALYNVYGVVDLPTRITDSTSKAIDNFIMDRGENAMYTISLIYNGLLDHDAQLLVLHGVTVNNQIPLSTVTRHINESTITHCRLLTVH